MLRIRVGWFGVCFSSRSLLLCSLSWSQRFHFALGRGETRHRHAWSELSLRLVVVWSRFCFGYMVAGHSVGFIQVRHPLAHRYVGLFGRCGNTVAGQVDESLSRHPATVAKRWLNPAPVSLSCFRLRSGLNWLSQQCGGWFGLVTSWRHVGETPENGGPRLDVQLAISTCRFREWRMVVVNQASSALIPYFRKWEPWGDAPEL